MTTFTLMSYEGLANIVADERSFPSEDAISQVGMAIATEVLDLVSDNALEDHQQVLLEGLIGGVHNAISRLEREADRGRDSINQLLRDFDGSEINDTELQSATAKTQRLDVSLLAFEALRDAMAAQYAVMTGEQWSPARGSVKASKVTAAQIDAKDAIRAHRASKHQATDPGRQVVAFRGAPSANTADDANRIFDALNWALAKFPKMTLATTAAPGAEQLALKWARQKGVSIVLSKPDFARDGRGAPFKAGDMLLALDPVLAMTLDQSLNTERSEQNPTFGPAANFGQKATEAGVRVIKILQRA